MGPFENLPKRELLVDKMTLRVGALLIGSYSPYRNEGAEARSALLRSI